MKDYQRRRQRRLSKLAGIWIDAQKEDTDVFTNMRHVSESELNERRRMYEHYRLTHFRQVIDCSDHGIPVINSRGVHVETIYKAGFYRVEVNKERYFQTSQGRGLPSAHNNYWMKFAENALADKYSKSEKQRTKEYERKEQAAFEKRIMNRRRDVFKSKKTERRTEQFFSALAIAGAISEQ